MTIDIINIMGRKRRDKKKLLQGIDNRYNQQEKTEKEGTKYFIYLVLLLPQERLLQQSNLQ